MFSFSFLFLIAIIMCVDFAFGVPTPYALKTISPFIKI